MGKRPFFFSCTFLIVIGAIFAILAYAYLWGTQTVLAFTLRNQARKIAILNEKPVPLVSVAANSDPGTKLVHAGFSFEVPWNDLDLQKSKFGGNIAVFAFQSGRVVSFYGPPANHEDLLSAFEKMIGDNRGTSKKLFGPKTTATNYAFHRAILEETPDKVSPFEDQREAVRSSMLLMLKGTSSVGGQTGLFQVQSQGWRGFQFDDPSRNPQVTLEVYDGEDRHIEIVFHSGKDVSSSLTQADINRTLQTLGATSDPQTIPLENKFAAKPATTSGAGSH